MDTWLWLLGVLVVINTGFLIRAAQRKQRRRWLRLSLISVALVMLIAAVDLITRRTYWAVFQLGVVAFSLATTRRILGLYAEIDLLDLERQVDELGED